MSKKKCNFDKKTKKFTDEILKILSKEPDKEFTSKQFFTKLQLNDTQSRNQIIKDIEFLKSTRKIQESQTGKYKITPSEDYLIGRIDIVSRKIAYFISDQISQDVLIPFNNLNSALDKDEVKVYIYNRRREKRYEAEVVKIIKRHKTEFVGLISIQKNFGFVSTTNSKMYTDIFVPKDKIGKAQHGDVVVVKIESWPKHAESPFGRIIKTLGKSGEQDTEMHAILSEYELPYDFPGEVESFAYQLDTTITDTEISKRRDMRNALTLTIDPKDAKDFDDAISFEVLENKNYRIGIHIADVSHYLQEGTILDQEAYNRATSVYLVDRVVPMLPEILSNFACSLRPNEEKYTFSAVFDVDENAQIVEQWFGRTVIHSDKRFSYEEVQYIIETQNETIPEEISLTQKEYQVEKPILQAVLTLDKLAKILRKKRIQNGSILFDKVEVKFNLDHNAEPIDVYFKEQKDANQLIEEFMLLANRKVAEFIGKKSKPFIYRIHDQPSQDKLYDLQNMVTKFGYTLQLRSKKEIIHSLNKLLKTVKGKKEQNLIDTLAIRSMSKAKYSTENIGHYGLAFDYYSHFTSPIRRYPDVMVHRLLQTYLTEEKKVDKDLYQKKCEHCSAMELLATSAERDSIKYMQVKYMQNQKDKSFLGTISGVTEWGIFVEIIENKCEGMIRIKEIKDDYYSFDEKQHALVGKITKNILQLGDELYVRVKNANLIKKQLDFELIQKKE